VLSHARPINPAAYEPRLAAAVIRHVRPRLHSDRRTRPPSRPSAAIKHFPLFSIFHGTHDILFVDTRKLIARLDQEGIAVDFFEFPHVGDVPMSEAQAAVAKLAGLINGK
jgi:acetyl esterase/lipase